MLALLAARARSPGSCSAPRRRPGSASLADFTSLLAIVVLIALLAGMAYAFVAIPSQTQLQEEIPEDVRGRVFGILNMLVSVASFAPIIIVGPSPTSRNVDVLFLVAIAVLCRHPSICRRAGCGPRSREETATGPSHPAGLDPVAVAPCPRSIERDGRRAGLPADGEDGASAVAPMPPTGTTRRVRRGGRRAGRYS